MTYTLIKNYNINDTVIFTDNTRAKIIGYAGTILGKQSSTNTLTKCQLYKVEYNNEVYYASDIGLNKKSSSIFKRVIANIGYRGCTNYSLFKKEYDLWKDMLYRCYWGNSNIYPYYGGIGITVDPKWHCFEIFLYDIVTLQNYNTFKTSRSKYEIDIAAKQKNVPENQRIYTAGRISLRLLYSSDVAAALDKFKSGGVKPLGTYTEVPVIGSIKIPESEVKIFNPLPNGNYPMDAYEYAIMNPPILPVPSNDDPGYNITRTFNGIHYNNTCIKPKKVNTNSCKKHIMCRIVKK